MRLVTDVFASWVAGSVLHIYGDSLVDYGATYNLTQGAWPISPPYQYHFSNGPLWPQYLANEYNFTVHSHAFGGATSNSSVIVGKTGPTESWPVLGAAQQAEAFLASPDYNPTEKATHLVCAGGNDIYFNFKQDGSGKFLLNAEAHIKTTANSIVSVARYLLSQASVDKVLVCDAYAMYATPTSGAVGPVVSSVMKFVTKQLARQIHEGVQGLKRDAAFATKSVDVLPMLAAMELALPTIPHNNEACAQVVSRTNYTVCDAPESYFFFDQFHPTTAGHKHMADALVGLLGR